MKTSVPFRIALVLVLVCSCSFGTVAAEFHRFCEELKDLPFWTRNSELLCNFCCDFEALSGVRVPLPSFCDTRCPDYNIPEEFLSSNATCTVCQEPDCHECYCTNGTCLIPVNGPESPDTGTGVQEPDTEVNKTGPEDSSIAKAASGKPTTSLYCGRCIPRRQCRPFWFCR